MKTLKYAMRFLLRSRSYTIINLLGLAFSLACCIILMRYIHRELTVDTHCVDRENVYALVSTEEGNSHLTGDLYNEIKEEIDRTGKQTRISRMLMEQYLTYEKEAYKTIVITADSSFFQFFHYPILQGDVSMEKPESAVITEDYAHRVFGKTNPIGKILHLNSGKEAIVCGVIGETENKSFLKFDIVLTTSLTEGMIVDFIRFNSGTDMEQINRLLGQERYRRNTRNPPPFTYSLMSVKDLYWNPDIVCLNGSFTYMHNYGNRSQIQILSAICCVLLLVGIINFVNLYLILSQKRRKEYGLKKVFGISAPGLFIQIWLENLLLITAAVMVAGLIMEISQIPINLLLSMPTGYTSFDIWLFGGFILILPLLTSIYPFLKYHYSPPVSSIRSIGNGRQSVKSRMVILFAQYILTFLLVVLALYFNRQLSMLLNTDPGFRTENVMIARLGQESNDLLLFGSFDEEIWRQHRGRLRALVEGIKQCPVVEHMNRSEILKPFENDQTVYNDRNEECKIMINDVSSDFFQTYNIKPVEGNISPTKGEEEWGVYDFMVANKAAMKVLGYTSCKDGKFILGAEMDYKDFVEAYPIRGIVENYYGGHLTEGYRPIIFRVSDREINEGVYQIAYQPGRLDELVEYLRQLQIEIYGNDLFEYTLLKDKLKELYENDKLIANIYTIFALIAIAISCLGLFGISLFDIRQRYREIGIRKINGAGMKDLYRLLFRKYVVVLGTAFVVAVPIAYYLITLYTQDFVVKAPIGIGIFIIALLVVALISLGTIYWQVHRAANINPADVVKSE